MILMPNIKFIMRAGEEFCTVRSGMNDVIENFKIAQSYHPTNIIEKNGNK